MLSGATMGTAHLVRDVAPGKVMVCLSFVLPSEVSIYYYMMHDVRAYVIAPSRIMRASCGGAAMINVRIMYV